MRIFHTIEEYKSSDLSGENAGSAVTLGKFDGIHTGHRKLVRNIVRYAQSHQLASVVFAIEVDQDAVLSHEERALYLESLGVDVLVECPFSREFMNLHPAEFVRTILEDTLHTRYAAVGTDFVFGHNREGNACDLQAICERYGCRTVILEKERFQGEDVSSTRVREALRKGDMELVESLLGRPYPILGTVEHGAHIGTGIGIPTVNLALDPHKILPPDGVYASITTLPDHSVRKGLTDIGTRPTVGGGARRAETTLMDFHSDLYGARISHALLRFIRPETKFSGLDELKKQIQKDRKTAWG